MNAEELHLELLEIARLLTLLTDEGDDRMHGVYVEAYSGFPVARAKGSTLDLIERARRAIG